MSRFAIIETDEGMTVTELPPGVVAEDTATKHGGVVVDPGPYPTFEDANDAMLALQEEDDEE
jgi:hypothetical protein